MAQFSGWSARHQTLTKFPRCPLIPRKVQDTGGIVRLDLRNRWFHAFAHWDRTRPPQDGSTGAACSGAFSARGALLWALVACLCGFSSGCVSPIDGGRGIAPFYETYPTAPGDSKWVVRPLVMYERQGEKRDVAALWPFYRNTREGNNRKQWLLPIWYSSHREHTPGRIDWDSFILPFFFFGHDPEEGGYFGAFPFAGRVKGIFGQDRFDFFLFPLYLRLRDRERVSTHYMWPFFNRVTGPYNEGLRIWPFYGRYTGTTRDGRPKYDRRFYLWPFVHAHENDLDVSDPTTARWLFPFYGRIQNQNRDRRSYLWPLYTYTTNQKLERVSHTSYLMGWNVTRSPDLDRTDFWPFFGLKETPDSLRQFALFPIQRQERWQTGTRRGTSFWFLPFYRRHTREDLREGTRSTHTRVWPLFSHRREPDGSVHVNALELFWFHDPERFDHLYSRFWRVYRSVERPPGQGSAWEVLWGALRREKTPERNWFSLLGGLYGWDQDESETTWRVLWIPF